MRVGEKVNQPGSAGFSNRFSCWFCKRRAGEDTRAPRAGVRESKYISQKISNVKTFAKLRKILLWRCPLSPLPHMAFLTTSPFFLISYDLATLCPPPVHFVHLLSPDRLCGILT